jgi:hypothetical protein
MMATALVIALGLHWQSPQMLGVALLVGVLTVLAVALLYPSQVRSLPPAWRVALPALRIAALLALAASVARPVAEREMREEEQGAVVVLVDRSASMGVRDTFREPPMLVALADGLGQLPGGVRTRGEVFKTIEPDIARLPTLFEEVKQAQVELEVAQLQGRDETDPRKRVESLAAELTALTRSLAGAQERLKKSPEMAKALALLANLPPITAREWASVVERRIERVQERAAQFQTESDASLYKDNADVRAACDRLAAMTRFELIEEAITHPADGRLAKLPPRAPVFGFAVGARVTPLPLRGAGGQPVRRLLIEPDDPRSDLTGGVRDALDRMRHQRVQAVVLFTDGRQVGAAASIASSLMGSGVPVYAVCPAPLSGDRSPAVRDVAIDRVVLPPSLFVGETLNASVDVRWSGYRQPPKEATIQVGSERQTRRVEVRKGAAGVATVTFSLSVVEPGPQRVTVSVPELDDEISAENNTVTRWVKVVSDKFDVLLVGGSPSWDFRYLRNALARTASINAETVLLDGNKRLTFSAEQILTKDVVILCDAPAAALAPEQWEALRKAVAQRGGSLILMAGQAHLPREYTGDYLSEFLPYRRPGRGGSGAVAWRVWPGEEPEFRVVPAPGAPVGDVLALDDDPQASADRWISLPPVFRFLGMPELKEAAQAILVERGSGAPILTRQRLGRGRVFFLGVDETWRWRYRVGERDQDRFFRQLVRAAADEPYAATNGYLSLDADRVTVGPVDPVHVRARVIDPTPQQAGRTAELDVVREGAVVRSQSLSPVGDEDSGRYEGTVDALPVGEYRLRLHGPDGSELEYPLHVTESREAEMSNLAPDEEILRRLAAASTGGASKTLEQFKDVPQLLGGLRDRESRTAELRLWSSWYLYAFVVSCLAAEWAMRKRFGLS